jgi:hypothetical protein
VIDGLLRDEQQIREATNDLGQAFDRLIAGQVEFVVADRELAQVYHREINNLPEEDRRRLRRKQRLYLEEWVHLLNEMHDDLTDTDARVVVHAAIGAIQSPCFTTPAWLMTDCGFCSPSPLARSSASRQVVPRRGDAKRLLENLAALTKCGWGGQDWQLGPVSAWKRVVSSGHGAVRIASPC